MNTDTRVDKGYIMIQKLKNIFKPNTHKNARGKDLSGHRVYTTHYEDLCQ